MAASNCKVCSYFQFIIERRIQKSSPIGHDFFEEQPIKDATVFLTRYTAHNWSDKYAKDILINLRQTAKADTKLMIVDAVVEHVCPTPVLTAGDVVPGYHPEVHPKPLLANLGPANVTAYNMDITVC